MKATQQGIFKALRVPPASAVLLVLAAALVFGSNAALRAQTGELQLVQPNAVPQNGTFASMQFSNLPPIPRNPYSQLDVYSRSGAPGWYWVDDRAVDYAALRQQRQMESAQRSLQRQSGLDSQEDPILPPGDWGGSGGGEGGSSSSGPPLYMTSDGLCLWPPVFTSSNSLSLTLTNVEAGGINDLYYTTNLALLAAPALCRTNWAWLGRGYPGQSVFTVTNPPQPQCYFILGNAAIDIDFDGLPDAYENLISHTPPNEYNVVSSDGYGTPDGWYLQQGLNPLAAGIGTQDADQDGLLNWQEYLWGTDPQAAEGFSVWVSTPNGTTSIP